MDYYKYLIKKLDEVVSENNCDYILYPYGERAVMIKGILNVLFGIDEKAVIDNVLCNKYERIKPLEYLQKAEMDNCKILITSNNVEIYEEIRKKLYEIVKKENCIELFPIPPEIELARRVPTVIEKMKRIGMTQEQLIYCPEKIKSVFFLPLLPRDDIQTTIFLNDDYYDRENLDTVFSSYENGIIGRTIRGGEGCILDIGANIGNHTLFFCNEYNAQKVYCFEPIKETFHMLEENIRLNHLEQRVVLNAFALGERDERGSVAYAALNNLGATALKSDEDGELSIRKLDGIGIAERVLFIKIDVEGMERKVIKGGIELIRKNHPYIMVESDEQGFPETREILGKMGYKYKMLNAVNWLFYYAE